LIDIEVWFSILVILAVSATNLDANALIFSVISVVGNLLTMSTTPTTTSAMTTGNKTAVDKPETREAPMEQQCRDQRVLLLCGL